MFAFILVAARPKFTCANMQESVQMQEAVQQAQAIFGPCDIMVCNAGATQPGERQDGIAHYDNLMITKPTNFDSMHTQGE